MAEELDIIAFNTTPFGGNTTEADIIIWGVDWSDAAFSMLIGAASDLVADIELGVAAAGTEGISATYSATYQHPTNGSSGPATLVRPQIDEGTLSALTYDGVNDLELKYTLYVTPTDGLERVHCFGAFTIKQQMVPAP